MSPHPNPLSPVSSEHIDDVDVSTEMRGSFLEYAYSVIYSRALPDARDGLKPVQRRILYQMTVMGLRPDRGHVKSARVTGEVMGKLHPHGDSAIYDALVRMAQDFNLRVPLVDGHGNFGSLDDGPAAARYTEARLTPAAMAMTSDLDEDVVDFVPNYDNQLTQPDVLPAAFPNLLVNGASGIAVGMATNMAPHNLGEVIAAAQHLVSHPDATLDELMEFVPGPDLPSGGTIVGLKGIRDAYEKGRGSFKTRATVSIEKITARKSGLVVTELPYQVGPEKVIEKIKDGVSRKKLTGITSVDDLSDRTHGLRLVIGIKTGFDPAAVLETLYRHTPLEDSFSMNNVALVGGAPQTLGLRDLLRVYVDHRLVVITRRSRFRLAKRQDRLHLVLGMLIAIVDIDEVIQIIRASDDVAQARERLCGVFELSHTQADYILELRLRRLTKFSRVELEAERDQLLSEIAELETLLGSDELLRQRICDELAETAEQFSTPRRTLLTETSAAEGSRRSKPASLEISDSPCVVFLSTTGRLLRVDVPEEDAVAPFRPLTAPRRRGKHDAIAARVATTRRGRVGLITDSGQLLRFSPVDLPACPPNSIQLAAGVWAHEYVTALGGDETAVTLVDLAADAPLALGTRSGIVKRVSLAECAGRDACSLITLKPGDVVVGAAPADDAVELLFVTSDAQLLRFGAELVRAQGRGAGGMVGIRTSESAHVVFFGALSPDAVASALVVTAAHDSAALPGTDPGSAKWTPLADYPAKGRATRGVRTHRFIRGEDALSAAWVGQAPAHPLGAGGAAVVLEEQPSRRDASGTPLAAAIETVGGAVVPASEPR